MKIAFLSRALPYVLSPYMEGYGGSPVRFGRAIQAGFECRVMNFHPGSLFSNKSFTAYPSLPLSGFSGFDRSGIALLSNIHRRLSGEESFAQQPNSPSAQAKSNKAADGHNPLSNRIAEIKAIGYIFSAFSGAVSIMFIAGRFSWRNGGCSSVSFYGGLFGGLVLAVAWFVFTMRFALGLG